MLSVGPFVQATAQRQEEQRQHQQQAGTVPHPPWLAAMAPHTLLPMAAQAACMVAVEAHQQQQPAAAALATLAAAAAPPCSSSSSSGVVLRPVQAALGCMVVVVAAWVQVLGLHTAWEVVEAAALLLTARRP
jgi:hypothetical protein